MKKALKIALISVLSIILLAIVLGYFFLNSAVRSAIVAFGPKVTKTDLSVRSVSISPFSGDGSVTAVVVGNPEGFKSTQAASVGTVRIGLQLGSVFSDPLVIKHLHIETPEITWEAGLKGGNISRILSNIDEFLGAEPSTRKVIIDDFKLTNCKVRLAVPIAGATVTETKVPELHLTGIGRKRAGVTVAEAIQQIMLPVSKAVMESASELPGVDGGLLKKAKGAIDGIRGMIGE